MNQKRNYLILFTLLLAFMLGVLLPVQKISARNAENELFLIAQKAFEDGFYDVAIRYIDQLLTQHPQGERKIQATLLLGQCYFFNAQYIKAFEIFKNLSTSSIYQDAVLFWLGETYLKAKDYLQSKQQYEKLLQLYPNSDYAPQARYGLGWIDFEQERYEPAQKTFSELSKSFPNHPIAEEALFRLGECAFHLAQYDQALNAFTRHITEFPKSLRQDHAHFYVAESHYNLASFLKAIEHYTKAQQATYNERTKITANIGIGWSYTKLRDFNKAEQSFKDALALSQLSGISGQDALFGLANLYTDKKDLEAALSCYDDIISETPQSARIQEALLGRANILYTLERFDEAILQYQSLITAVPTDAPFENVLEKAHLGLAWTYMRIGQPVQAISEFQRVANRTRSKNVKVSALAQIGDSYQDLGDLDNAIITYDKILKDFPNTPYTDYVQYRQGIALLKTGKIDSARLSFQSLQENFPRSQYLADVDYYLGIAYFKKHDWVAAKEKLTNFINALAPGHEFQPEAHYVLGLCYFYLNNYDEAIKIFQKIKKSYPKETRLVADSEFHIAQCLYRKGNIREAIKEFKLIVSKYPQTKTSLETLSWLGEYYFRTFDFDNAIVYFEQIIRDFPQSPEQGRAILALGKSYFEKKDFDLAINQFKRIDNSFPSDLVAQAKLAIADTFAEQLDPETAIVTYQAIIENSPEFQRNAYAKIAQLFLEKKDYSSALTYYQKAIDSPQGPEEIKKSEIHFSIGDIYEILNNYDRAVEEYLKIPYLYPNDIKWIIKAYLRVAKIFENTENWYNALNVYRKIMTYEVDERAFAQERLEWINENIPFADEY